MGSWAETCAVSKLAIRPGDKVLWVYAKPKYVDTTYELASIVWRYYDKENDWKKYQERNEEFQKKFPDNKEPLFSFSPPTKEFEWGFGEYDDYGWVEGENCPDEFENRKFLVKKDIADRMSEYGKTLIKREWDGRMLFLKESYLYTFLMVCSLTRIQLFGHKLLGRQYPDMDEMREMKKVRKFVTDEFNKMWKELRAEEKEFKEWSKGV